MILIGWSGVNIMDKVCVLMTTYNPKKYFLEQIESILSQEDVDVEIIIRDDGSTDKSFLNQIKYNFKITVLEGENLGVANNIMTLIRYAHENKKEYKYFAYSDQDDVWQTQKLKVGVKSLSKLPLDKPALYYSNLQVVDKDLNLTHMLFKRDVVKNTRGQSLSQVFCFACTTVFNYKMIEELTKYNIGNIGFDSLIYYIAIFIGNITYDENSYILYRQHGDNVSGQHDKGIKKLKRRIIQIIHFKEIEAPFEMNAEYLLNNIAHKLSPDDIKLLNVVKLYRVNLKFKVRLILNKEIKAGYFPKDFFNFIRIISNKY